VNPGAELLEAAEAALKWFDRFDAHAPSDMHFGGEGRVRRQLRGAIRRARGVGLAPDPQDFETAEAFEAALACYEEEVRTGATMSGREREAFARGFLEARAELMRR
jgi:hypothetical protein